MNKQYSRINMTLMTLICEKKIVLAAIALKKKTVLENKQMTAMKM